MIKKVLIIGLIMILIVALFAGCKTNTPAPAPAPSDQPKEVDWPTKEVTVYIPNPAGSNLDLSCRIMLEYLTQKTGKTFIPINEDTGMGTLAMQKVSGAAPDGYTMMFTGVGSNIQYYNGQTNLSTVDSSKFTIIAAGPGPKTDFDSVFVTTSDKPYKTWQEFLDYVNAHPGEVKYGTSSGTSVEVKGKILAEKFGIADKVKMVYATSTELAISLLGKQIDVAVMSGINSVQYIESGELVGLIHYIPEYKGSDKVLKQIPTLTDINAVELYSAYPMYIVGPGNMDKALVDKINATIAGAASEKEFVDRWDKMKSEYVHRDAATIQQEVKKSDDLIKGAYNK